MRRHSTRRSQPNRWLEPRRLRNPGLVLLTRRRVRPRCHRRLCSVTRLRAARVTRQSRTLSVLDRRVQVAAQRQPVRLLLLGAPRLPRHRHRHPTELRRCMRRGSRRPQNSTVGLLLRRWLSGACQCLPTRRNCHGDRGWGCRPRCVLQPRTLRQATHLLRRDRLRLLAATVRQRR